MLHRWIAICGMLCLAFVQQGGAEEGGADQSTPKRTWDSFTRACAKQDYQEASAFLTKKFYKKSAPSWVATRLCVIADQLLTPGVPVLSDDPEGNKRSDGIEEIGKIKGISRGEDTIRLRREQSQQESFSRSEDQRAKYWFVVTPSEETLEQWYQIVLAQWPQKYLPPSFHRVGPLGLAVWQWITLPAALGLLLLVSWIGVRLLRLLLRPLFSKDPAFWSRELITKLSWPVQLIFWSMLSLALLPYLYLGQDSRQHVSSLLNLVALWAGIGVGLQAMSALAEQLRKSTWLRFRPTTVSLIPAGLRLARILLVAVGVLFTLRELRYSITSLIAGFGIGGLAVALAAQKTVEQIFGGVMIGIDQPMRVGDLIRVGELQGTVESIGLRSTRIRTSDRSVITIPNGKLMEMNIENLTLRDKTRLRHIFRMESSTSIEHVRTLLEYTNALLHAHPHIWQSDIQLYLLSIADPSIDIEMIVWVLATETHEVAKVRQEILLDVLNHAEKNGIRWMSGEVRFFKKSG